MLHVPLYFTYLQQMSFRLLKTAFLNAVSSFAPLGAILWRCFGDDAVTPHCSVL